MFVFQGRCQEQKDPCGVQSGLLFTAESRTCCAITGHNLWPEMGFAHRRRRFKMAKPVTITAQKAVNSNQSGGHGHGRIQEGCKI